MPPAIRFDGVAKRYIIHHQRPRSFQEALVNMVHRPNGDREVFWALQDVSFSIDPGETVGIIGPNGSGKSTALKLISRIIEPTNGSVAVAGRVAALIELGAGFHPDLTGRENIYLLGSIMGISGREMDRRFSAIVEFAELERFIDTAVKHYSSGMYMRLGFATAIHVDADLFLIDELLAVGDEHFQRKCLEAIQRFQQQGMTVVLVTHDLPLVGKFCPRTILLQQGRLVADGPTPGVVQQYLEVAAH